MRASSLCLAAGTLMAFASNTTQPSTLAGCRNATPRTGQSGAPHAAGTTTAGGQLTRREHPVGTTNELRIRPAIIREVPVGYASIACLGLRSSPPSLCAARLPPPLSQIPPPDNTSRESTHADTSTGVAVTVAVSAESPFSGPAFSCACVSRYASRQRVSSRPTVPPSSFHVRR